MEAIASGECAGVDVGGVRINYHVRDLPRENDAGAVGAVQGNQGIAIIEAIP